MRELLEYLVKNLVAKSDEVKIEGKNSQGILDLNLAVAKEDMGIVIGKSGQTIKAIRRLLVARALAEGQNLRVNLNLQEAL